LSPRYYHVRPPLLLTFDDGFASNYDVAAPLLEAHGIRGLFFVVPAFSMASPTAAPAFYRDRIRGRADRFERSMTPDEIADLARRGHTIGNHTFSHCRLSDVSENDLRHEIDDSAEVIESWIGRRVEAFAWPFVWDAVTPEAHAAIRARHSYCFSPCAGLNDTGRDSPALLWRANAEADRSFREFRFQCSGLADIVNAGRRAALIRRLADPRVAGDRAAA
jgi:peptidoglycan/xylan/chitin deacetylase (PgdA/CDA1 family)